MESQGLRGSTLTRPTPVSNIPRKWKLKPYLKCRGISRERTAILIQKNVALLYDRDIVRP